MLDLWQIDYFKDGVNKRHPIPQLNTLTGDWLFDDVWVGSVGVVPYAHTSIVVFFDDEGRPIVSTSVNNFRGVYWAAHLYVVLGEDEQVIFDTTTHKTYYLQTK
jgi:hypothetical protein